VESPEAIFGEYTYFSSYSTTWLEHVRTYADMAVAKFKLSSKSLVLEVASNDGCLLKCFADRGVRVLGIEPAKNVAAWAIESGIPTIADFFGVRLAKELARDDRRADLIVANNVLAHVPLLDDFVKGMALALRPSGTATFEFPHLLRLIERGEFDTIYHEHLSYFSLSSAKRVLVAFGLSVVDVEELAVHGGSLRVYAMHAATAEQPDRRVEELLQAEKRAGLSTLTPYRQFGAKAKRVKRDLLEFVRSAKRAGKHIVGYGAPAKAVTLLNYCGLGSDVVEYTADRSPHKQGKYLPGVRVPIVAPEKIYDTKPDFVLVFPWNIKDEIMEQMKDVRSWGGRFVVAIPELMVTP